ncbi:ATP-binding protein [Streptomyces sp. GC420]|nr:ATP-binding protein [Streptomyces sp. GC420]
MIPAARDFADAFLDDAAARGVQVARRQRDAVRLVVSELVTNVVRHAPGPCRLGLRLRDGTLEVSVTDTSPSTPAPLPRDPSRIGQHGLEIVHALCVAVEEERTPAGKTVRVCIAVT